MRKLERKEIGLKVFVYFNLHKKVWSIKALEGERKGLVIGHSKDVLLLNVTPKVSEAGRQRVLREKSKNVHAGLVGTLIDYDNNPTESLSSARKEIAKEITYNPYRYNGFVYKSDHNSFVYSGWAWLNENKQVFTYG